MNRLIEEMELRFQEQCKLYGIQFDNNCEMVRRFDEVLSIKASK